MASALDMVAGLAPGQGVDLFGAFQEGRNNRLAGQALQGNTNALNSLAGVDPEGFMAVSGFQDKRKQAEAEAAAAQAEKVAAVLYRADTPEKWTQAINYLKKTGHDVSPEEENFANKDAVLGEFLSIKEQMAQGNSDRSFNAEQDYRGASLDIDRQRLAQGDKQPADEYLLRKQQAADAGLAETDPRYQTFILTGTMPKESAQKLTATDKNAILEADQNQMTMENVDSALKQAEDLNDDAGSGYFANTQAFLARNDPTGFFDDKKGQATTEFTNLVMNQALNQMKAIFGGNPTEGERAVLLQLQGSVDKTPAERKAILANARRLAQRRLQFNKDRASELRSGEFYQPDAGPAAPAAAAPATGEAPEWVQPFIAQGAKQAPDGNWYAPDPDRPGKFVLLQPDNAQ